MRKMMLGLLGAATLVGGCTDYGNGGPGYASDYSRYDYNNPDPQYGGYYADRYYRDGPRYRERRLGSSDRVYRGQDGRYYCRRSDGTTGLVAGAAIGGILGTAIAPGGSGLLGAILGGVGGAVAGQAIDRSNTRDVRCR